MIAKKVRPALSKPSGVFGCVKSRKPVEELERRDYQGPSKRILLLGEAEYMTASLL